jgi:uncharacterized membrane protein HdeD (DUF308 family)
MIVAQRETPVILLSGNCTGQGDSLKFVSCLLLLSGFFLVLAALVLFPAPATRIAFVVAGLGVEVLGVGLLTRAYTLAQKEQR